MSILMIDNYDSFTYNLVQYLQMLGAEVDVVRNDEITVEQIAARAPQGIVISPGPCTPNEAGISLQVIRELGPTIPMLGVCLGHQAMGQVFGGNVVRAPEAIHGKTTQIFHDSSSVFANLPSPYTATRYHSLVVDRETFPSSLRITAWNEDDLIMGLQHVEFPIHGVQFHPESILTEHGHALLKNFLDLT